MNEVDKAERQQAWKAFLIPASLFIACLFNAAGIYIIYAGNGVGVFFLGTGMLIIIAGMFLFITFQNEHRAGGNWQRVDSAEQQPSTAELHEDAEDEPGGPVYDFSVDERPVTHLSTAEPPTVIKS